MRQLSSLGPRVGLFLSSLAIVAVTSGGCGKVASPTSDTGGADAPDSRRPGEAGETTVSGGRSMTGATGGRAPGPEGGAGVGGEYAGTAGTAGTGMVTPGGTGGRAGSGGSSGCPVGQLNLQGQCACPAYAPDYCADQGKCVDLQRDPQFCGHCTVGCGPTQACAGGYCSEPPDTLPITVNCGELELLREANVLYVLDPGHGILSSVDLSDFAAPVALARFLVGGRAFAIYADHAYVANGHDLLRVGISNEGTQIVTIEQDPISDVTVAGGQLYYTSGHRVLRIDPSATEEFGVEVARATGEGLPAAVTVIGNQLLFASDLSFNVELQRLDSDLHTELAASQGGLRFGHRSIQVAGPHVFWSNFAVQAASLEQPEPSPVTAAVGRGDVVAFDVALPDVYLATAQGDLQGASAFDENSSWLARGLGNVTSLASDDDFVYAASECNVVRVPR